MDIAARIKEARRKAQISQEELARRAGISVHGVAVLEQGARSDPHLSTMAKIADALGLPLEFFVKDDDLLAQARAYLKGLQEKKAVTFNVVSENGDVLLEDVHFSTAPDALILGAYKQILRTGLAPGEKVSISHEVAVLVQDFVEHGHVEIQASPDLAEPILPALA